MLKPHGAWEAPESTSSMMLVMHAFGGSEHKLYNSPGILHTRMHAHTFTHTHDCAHIHTHAKMHAVGPTKHLNLSGIYINLVEEITCTSCACAIQYSLTTSCHIIPCIYLAIAIY